MGSPLSWVFLQLAGVAAGVAVLCMASERDTRTDARVWLAVALIAGALFSLVSADG